MTRQWWRPLPPERCAGLVTLLLISLLAQQSCCSRWSDKIGRQLAQDLAAPPADGASALPPTGSAGAVPPSTDPPQPPSSGPTPDASGTLPSATAGNDAAGPTPGSGTPTLPPTPGSDSPPVVTPPPPPSTSTGDGTSAPGATSPPSSPVLGGSSSSSGGDSATPPTSSGAPPAAAGSSDNTSQPVPPVVPPAASSGDAGSSSAGNSSALDGGGVAAASAAGTGAPVPVTALPSQDAPPSPSPSSPPTNDIAAKSSISSGNSSSSGSGGGNYSTPQAMQPELQAAAAASGAVPTGSDASGVSGGTEDTGVVPPGTGNVSQSPQANGSSTFINGEFILMFQKGTQAGAALPSVRQSVQEAVNEHIKNNAGSAAAAAASTSGAVRAGQQQAAGGGAFQVTNVINANKGGGAGGGGIGAGVQTASASSGDNGLIHAVVIKVSDEMASPVIQGIQNNPDVNKVLPNFQIATTQITEQCAPPAAVSGTAAVPTVSVLSTTCQTAANKLVWYGERCGADLSQIKWNGLYAADKATGVLVPGCVKLRTTATTRTANATNLKFFGDCGVAPTAARLLPKLVCVAATAASSICDNLGAANPNVITTTATLQTPYPCDGTQTTSVTLTGSPCGPDNKWVQWNQVTPGSCQPVRRSTNMYRNAEWLGQCGVPPRVAPFLSINACSYYVAPAPTATRLPRMLVPDTDSISLGLKRIEGAEPEGETAGNATDFQQGAKNVVPDISAITLPPAVAVLDTGVFKHPDLNVMGGLSTIPGDPDPHNDLVGHGTHVAGIIAAKAGGGYTVGVSPGAPVYAVRVMTGKSGGGGDLFAGLYWVIDNAKKYNIRVINMSLGCRFGSHDALLDYCSVFDQIVAQGVTVVVSAGNDGKDYQLQFPAGCPQVLVVTAMVDLDGTPDPTDAAGSFSNYLDLSQPTGTPADRDRTLAAPGWAVLSTVPTTLDPSGVGQKSGTSQASPFVAGIALNCYMFGACSSNTTHENAKVAAAAKDHYATMSSGFGFTGDALSSPDTVKHYGLLANGEKWAQQPPATKTRQ